jgi:hypothetical protein
MSPSFRRIVSAALFLSVLSLELLLVAHFVPSYSSEDFGKFMTLSMGMLFVPFFLAVLAAVFVLRLLVLVALFPARLFWSSTGPRSRRPKETVPH